MSKLAEYRGKRHLEKSLEPAGGKAGGGASGGKAIFVIQKHAASHLHYDVRLELDGVLKSWAVPKGPSCDPADKRLAVHVEDHPLDYAAFEGVIPKGEYGGGTVMVWDRGTYTTLGDAKKSYQKGEWKVELNGEKLHGRWVLVRMKGRGGKKAGDDAGKNWLLIKERDEYACDGGGAALLKENDRSAATGRSMEAIRDDWDKANDSGARGASGAATDPAAVPHSKKASMPAGISPQLATLVDDTPRDDAWVHEIKFDGYRLIARLERGKVKLLTRRGKDWTARFASIAHALRDFPADTAILDGEAVVLDERGVSQFQLLQNALRHKAANVVYFAFDLLYLDGYDLKRCSLLDRKRLLVERLGGDERAVVRYADHLVGSGRAFYDQACEHELEGVVSKRADAAYSQGRTRTWVKRKCQHEQEFLIVGYTDPSGSRTGFGALLLGTHDEQGELIYCGRVGTGFDEAMLEAMLGKLESRGRQSSPLGRPPPRREQRAAHWVRPELVAQVRFAEWTDDGRLRQPVFLGLREDKEGKNVVREMPQPVREVTKDGQAGPKPSGGELPPNTRLTNPERVLYPEQGLTKHDLALYYASVAGWMLPHLADRPLSLVRCPRGRDQHCFYQKHLGDTAPKTLRQVMVPEGDGEEAYAVVDDLPALLSLVQLGVLEIHPWGARADRPDAPDRLIFDLDPGPGTTWQDVVHAAALFREALDYLKLASFCKLTGGKGVHVVVPIARRHDWEQAKAFARDLADRIAQAAPDRYTTNMSKRKRQGKVYLDFQRNSRGATAVSPYSTRARPGAPVATPIRWDELTEKLSPNQYTVQNLAQRLRQLKEDPWAGFFDVRQSLTKAVLRKVKTT